MYYNMISILRKNYRVYWSEVAFPYFWVSNLSGRVGLEDGTVTVRCRDSMQQLRINAQELLEGNVSLAMFKERV